MSKIVVLILLTLLLCGVYYSSAQECSFEIISMRMFTLQEEFPDAPPDLLDDYLRVEMIVTNNIFARELSAEISCNKSEPNWFEERKRGVGTGLLLFTFITIDSLDNSGVFHRFLLNDVFPGQGCDL